MPNLREAYFQRIHAKDFEGYQQVVYRPLGHPMVLFADDGTPLASLHFECQTTSEQVGNLRGQTLITNRPDKSVDDLQFFQGLVDRPNQEVQLVITNLLESDAHENAYINFNVLRSDEKVTMVDPGGVNQVNELRPGESYAVKSDQNAGHAALKLTTIESSAGGGAKATVKEDEDSKEGPKGTYFYLSVTPQLGKKVAEDLFTNTQWATVDFITRREKTWKPKAMPYMYGMARGGGDRLLQRREGFAGGARGAGLRAPPTQGGGRRRFGKKHGHYAKKGKTKGKTKGGAGPRPMAVGNFTPVEELDPGEVLLGGGDSVTKSLGPPAAVGSAADFHEEVEEVGEDVADDMFEFEDDDEGDDGVGAVPQRTLIEADGAGSESSDDDDEEELAGGAVASVSAAHNISAEAILKTKAAALSRGRHVDVSSSFTGIEYNYERASSRCVIGLSIADNLNFASLLLPIPMADLKKEAEELLAAFVDGTYTQFLQKAKIYEDTTCVICMDDMTDCVLYTCGHKCLMFECSADVQKCPICRKWISAKIKTNPSYGEDYDGEKKKVDSVRKVVEVAT